MSISLYLHACVLDFTKDILGIDRVLNDRAIGSERVDRLPPPFCLGTWKAPNVPACLKQRIRNREIVENQPEEETSDLRLSTWYEESDRVDPVNELKALVVE